MIKHTKVYQKQDMKFEMETRLPEALFLLISSLVRFSENSNAVNWVFPFAFGCFFFMILKTGDDFGRDMLVSRAY